MGSNAPGFSVHEFLQARIPEWLTVPSSRGSSQPRDQTQVSHTAGWFFTVWAAREAHSLWPLADYRAMLPSNWSGHKITPRREDLLKAPTANQSQQNWSFHRKRGPQSLWVHHTIVFLTSPEGDRAVTCLEGSSEMVLSQYSQACCTVLLTNERPRECSENNLLEKKKSLQQNSEYPPSSDFFKYLHSSSLCWINGGFDFLWLLSQRTTSLVSKNKINLQFSWSSGSRKSKLKVFWKLPWQSTACLFQLLVSSFVAASLSSLTPPLHGHLPCVPSLHSSSVCVCFCTPSPLVLGPMFTTNDVN